MSGGFTNYESMPSGKKVKSLKKKYSLFFSDRRDILEPEPEPVIRDPEKWKDH